MAINKDHPSNSGPRLGAEQVEPSGWVKPLPEKLPRPTYWPILVAMGVMMMAMGVVTNYVVTIFGFVLLVIAIAGWIGEIIYGE